MATIINNPGSGDSGNGGNGGGSGLVIGIVIALVVLAIVFFYVLPNMGGNNTTPAPSNTGTMETPSSVNVDVPDEIDVNVKQ